MQGEEGQNGMFGPFGSADPAIKQFEQKFMDKTRNNWKNRDQFVPSAGKYTLIEVGEFEDASATSTSAAAASGPTFSSVCCIRIESILIPPYRTYAAIQCSPFQLRMCMYSRSPRR